MRTLYLVRHAKSSWADSTLADHQRPLNKRGLRDAPMMGRRLAEKKLRLDGLWASPALRAVETAHLLAAALKFPKKDIQIHERLYTGLMDELLIEIRSCPEAWKSLLLVSHNPALAECVDYLIERRFASQISAVPTCAVVALEFEGASWTGLKKNQGRLLFFDYPKKTDS